LPWHSKIKQAKVAAVIARTEAEANTQNLYNKVSEAVASFSLALSCYATARNKPERKLQPSTNSILSVEVYPDALSRLNWVCYADRPLIPADTALVLFPVDYQVPSFYDGSHFRLLYLAMPRQEINRKGNSNHPRIQSFQWKLRYYTTSALKEADELLKVANLQLQHSETNITEFIQHYSI